MKERRLTEKTKVTLNVATFIFIIIFIIGAAIAYGVREKDIGNNIKYLIEKDIIQDAQIIESQKNDAEYDKIYTEMNTNIKWIMDALVEIKEEIK